LIASVPSTAVYTVPASVLSVPSFIPSWVSIPSSYVVAPISACGAFLE